MRINILLWSIYNLILLIIFLYETRNFFEIKMEFLNMILDNAALTSAKFQKSNNGAYEIHQRIGEKYYYNFM